MKAMKKIILLLAILGMCQGGVTDVFAQDEQDTLQYTLRISVKDLETNGGRIMIAVFNSPDSFLMKPFKVMAIPADNISSNPASLNLPRGVYAVSLFQDTNNNGILDTGAYGIPTEKYGFSNDAEAIMGPPVFEKCSFQFKGDTNITISLR